MHIARILRLDSSCQVQQPLTHATPTESERFSCRRLKSTKNGLNAFELIDL